MIILPHKFQLTIPIRKDRMKLRKKTFLLIKTISKHKINMNNNSKLKLTKTYSHKV